MVVTGGPLKVHTVKQHNPWCEIVWYKYSARVYAQKGHTVREIQVISWNEEYSTISAKLRNHRVTGGGWEVAAF